MYLPWTRITVKEHQTFYMSDQKTPLKLKSHIKMTFGPPTKANCKLQTTIARNSTTHQLNNHLLAIFEYHLQPSLNFLNQRIRIIPQCKHVSLARTSATHKFINKSKHNLHPEKAVKNGSNPSRLSQDNKIPHKIHKHTPTSLLLSSCRNSVSNIYNTHHVTLNF
ncbi:LAME_0H14642g1_1 [Lachancea meyersii CBS 8951]|uniref:LAME_0H14642g1_1 n=1 Tax=Lachancea meyersii CBS 8951 TaxID=1266667 RepID=A0A1G4KHU3_9SACH|nr:LAME_0H14642g1_1 [Lachancea meyersii CBS 8951]